VTDLPWLEAPFAAIRASAAAGRLPQGLLVHEVPGAGGMRLVLRIAQLVLCQAAATAAPCGHCAGCRRVESGEHPDLLRIAPKEESKLQQITVDDIREACEQLVMTSYEGRGSVAVIHPADAMNVNASNSLLKTLEEPRPSLHLILVTSRPSALPATLLSRCQRLKVPAPDRAVVLDWLGRQRPSSDWPAALDALGGAALDALDSDPAALRRLRDDTWQALREGLRGRLDVVRTADTWSRDELPLRLNCLERYFTRRVLEGPETGGESPEPGAVHLQGPDLELNIGTALALLDDVRDIRRLAGTTLNKALMVEQLLWRLVRPAQRRDAVSARTPVK
jgi:DNA polymerase-3 subunit delta'